MERLDMDIKNTLKGQVDHVEVPPTLFAVARLAASGGITPLNPSKKGAWATVWRPAAWAVGILFAVLVVTRISAPDMVQAGMQKAACTVSGFCGAKGDPKEVASVMNNLRLEVPFLYELNGYGDPYLSVYRKGMVTLYYGIPEGDTTDGQGNLIQGIMFIREYEKASEGTIGGESRFSPFNEIKPAEPSKTFEVNGMQWNYHDRFEGTYTTEDGKRKISAESIDIPPVLRSEKDGAYYEVDFQGDITDEELVAILKKFQPSGRSE